MSDPVRLTIQTAGDVTVVEFLETLVWEMFQVEQISNELAALVEEKGCRRIVLDLARVEMISSSTLGVLIDLKHRLDDKQGRLVIAGLREELMNVFRVTRLENRFEFHTNRQAALAALGGPA
jgi:anti-anti-sigma factor